MSGVMPSNDRQPMLSATPQALTDLARSLEGEGPSPHVEQALDAAWQAMHASIDARQASQQRRPWLAWGVPALAAAAALLLAAAWVGWETADRGVPRRGAEQVGLDAAVPGGPFEPPPPSVPAEARPPVRTPEGAAPASRRAAPPPRAPSTRPDATARPAARPAQAAVVDDPEPFIWLRGADEIEPGLGVHLVRVQVPRLRWDAGTPRRELVDADVLMGDDGQARAVRVVRTGSR